MPLTRILVAIDFSAQSEAALEQAIVLAEHTGAALELLWVEDRIPASAVTLGHAFEELDRVLAATHDESATQLADLARQARERNLVVSHHVARGHADEAIVERAEQEAVDLVVVGTKGLTGLKRFFLGSVAEKVVRMSHTSVLVARGHLPRFGRVLVATDFSPASERALDLAMGLAAHDAEVVLFHAWQYPPGTMGMATALPKHGDPLAELRDQLIAHNVRRGELLCQRAGNPGQTVRFVQSHGAPAHEIQSQLEAQAYDLVAVSTHGTRGFRRFLLGSVAEVTVRHAPCSVLVVHAGNVAAPEVVTVADTSLPQPA